MAELLTPLPTLIAIPQARLPSCFAWERLSLHWPAPEDRELPDQWDSKVRLFLDWCRTRGLPALPASPRTVGSFLVDQAEIKAKSTDSATWP